jgi:hypothetical protein
MMSASLLRSRTAGCLFGWLLAACSNSHSIEPAPSRARRADAGQSGVGAKASARLDEVSASGISGTAALSATATGVDIMVSIRGKSIHLYNVRMLAGSDCTESVLEGAIWDDTRGTGITDVMTVGSGIGMAYYTRQASDAKPWTIGAPAASNVIGHALVVIDSNTMQAVACGTIMPAAGAASDAGIASGVALPAEVRAQLAGICVVRQIVRTGGDSCPDAERYAECADMHCELSACYQACADSTSCMAGASDVCAGECPQSADCFACISRVAQCSFSLCAELLACAPPTTPGGPCTELEQCCMRQGPRVQYSLELAHQAESLSGDSTCAGLLRDADFTTSVAYDPQCNSDADAGTE